MIRFWVAFVVGCCVYFWILNLLIYYVFMFGVCCGLRCYLLFWVLWFELLCLVFVVIIYTLFDLQFWVGGFSY